MFYINIYINICTVIKCILNIEKNNKYGMYGYARDLFSFQNVLNFLLPAPVYFFVVFKYYVVIEFPLTSPDDK